ncbi:MAG: hypothetical protein A2788_00735 [Candidatus Abawacabacteria bacterium RIFCSPHIGHO2_01_FULL_46_8]|uniref:Bacterial type II secretion system protein E domain-containing protein n=1 Tax=Candidatus Abawacabacteria bacterium RIFCSPHIGHO2_01_FULL_46_8 TaxID=1817815 RepID=A0A1F4XHH1_9BACT|nr:MAG: hypothetical protein A2788_00735 [Candidatus Abawacabacteria bacterium RIFCSPHIGHO2_01_FULL_46_8]
MAEETKMTNPGGAEAVESKAAEPVALDQAIAGSAKKLQTALEDGNVPAIVSGLIDYAIAMGSSDIHVEPQIKAVRIRYRVDGVLHAVANYLPRLHPAVVSRIKIISNLKLDEQRIPQDGRAEFTAVEPVTGRKIEADLRVSTFPTPYGEKVVLRILDRTRHIPALRDLGLRGRNSAVFEKAIKQPNGIILVSGPTGSGKTTTLYSALDVLNEEAVNILTIEDPVEYKMEGLSQSQVRPDIGYTFATGLRTALRQDPDIIMIGEMRDMETIEIAVRAALTGHLVFSTIHTNSAVDSIIRLQDMGVPGYLIAAAVRVILAQRLLRQLCPDCAIEVELEPGEISDLVSTLATVMDQLSAEQIQALEKIKAKKKLLKGQGCDKCRRSGYRGRLAIFELLALTGDINELIVKGGTRGQFNQLAKEAGMITLKQDGFIKVLNGETTLAEVYRVAAEQEELAKRKVA